MTLLFVTVLATAAVGDDPHMIDLYTATGPPGTVVGCYRIPTLVTTHKTLLAIAGM
jgi:hypothetical protein